MNTIKEYAALTVGAVFIGTACVLIAGLWLVIRPFNRKLANHLRS